MRQLQYFKGKVCTILTQPTNRFFDETQHVNTFVGIVDEIDDLGIWILRVSSATGKSFFTHGSIIGIIEESVKLFTDEEAREVKKSLEETRLPDKNPQQLISVDNLKQLKAKTEKK